MPADYVTEFADQAFREISAGTGDEIEKIVGSQPDAPGLANLLNSRPDLQALVTSLTGYTPSRWMLEHELGHVDARRRNLGIARVSSAGGPYKRAADSGLMGLSFSGGGIRSATFNLGILQGLAELNLLRCFDYLSTVSGGGYIHQWFAAWTRRRTSEVVDKQLIPLPEPGNPGSHPEPIRWLRRYSNYLTPETGLLSADTWVAFAIWLRNTLLNQTILISGLLFLALLLHGVTSARIIPQSSPSAAALVGVIFYLSSIAIYFLGRSLWRFRAPGFFGQGAVQVWLVLPTLASALLTTLLFPLIAANTIGIHLFLSFLGSMLVLLALALTITFAAGAPRCYLKSHNTAQYESVRQFWREKPKCFSHLKFAIAMLGLVIVSVLSAASGAAWIFGSLVLFAKLWSFLGEYWWRGVLIVGPPLILGGPLVTMVLVLGLLGRTFEDARREWLSRLAAWMGLYILLWISSFSFSLLGYDIVKWLGKQLWTAGVPALGSWAAASIGGLLAGKSPKSSGAKSSDAPKPSAVERLAVFGPYVFIAGLLLLLSAAAERILRSAAPHGSLVLLAVHLVILATCLLLAWRVDINEFSLHAFYRNRLARCYLGASNIPRHPNSFTGFDEADSDVAMSELLPEKGYNGPFPIFGTALNLTFGEDLAWQERKAASFAFTPLYSGYDVPWTAARGVTNLRFNGFVKTESYAYPKPGVHINTAAAISGAAISPNMGYHTSPVTAFLMTLFSVRLGW